MVPTDRPEYISARFFAVRSKDKEPYMEMLHECCSDWLFIGTALFGVFLIVAIGLLAAGKKEDDTKKKQKLTQDF
ncbi:hypothetical protein VU05_02970 [Desulfobulbus sp. F1]|nr:hypothetical protein [Desulfobulbus sp. F1]